MFLRWFVIVAAWGMLGLNAGLLFRSHRIYRKAMAWARRFHEEQPLESFIQALDECAGHICPLCGLNEDIRMAVDVNGSPLVMEAIESQLDGWHHVTDKDGQDHQLPCLAAPLHRLSSQIFDAMMKEKEAA